MSEFISDTLFVSLIEDNDELGFCYFSMNNSSPLKFYVSTNDSNKISYSPNKFEFRLVQQKNNEVKNLIGGAIEIIVVGMNKNTLTDYRYSQTYVHGAEDEVFTYDFSALAEVDITELIDITKITLTGYYQGQVIAYEELPIVYGTSEDMAKFSLVANGIYASVNDAGFSFTSEGLTVQNGNIIIKDLLGNKVFVADNNGNLYFQGTINSQDGFLSGWTLEQDELIDSAGQVGIHSGTRRNYGTDVSPVRFWAGFYNPSEVTLIEDESLVYYNFAVTEAGTVYANNANIRGDITATSGRILNTFYVGPNNNSGIIIYGNDLGSYIGSMRYSSGALGGGWTINSDGSAEFNNVSVRGKITSSVFEYDHISSIGGSLYVAPTLYTTTISNPIEGSDGSYTVTWELSQPVSTAFGNKAIFNGYHLLVDGNIQTSGQMSHISNVMMKTTNIDDPTKDKSLTVTFSSDLDLAGKYFEPGTAIVLYGTATTREGLYLTAMGENSPYLEIYSNEIDENGEKTNPIPAARLGNLSGIVDARFGSAGGKLGGYGLYSSNAYLHGQLVLPSAGITNQTEKKYGNSPIRIWAGEEATSMDNANFIVTEDGSLYAKQGTFEGIVKAVNSEFSGNIRAAGILLDKDEIQSEEARHDHFYVAYNDAAEGEEFTASYENYILNIDEEGLSIWEGGLQAYSDFANGENTLADQKPFAAYKHQEDGTAYPFMYLVDIGMTTELQSRMVINKLHSINFTPINNNYSILSTQLNNGFWLYGNTYAVGGKKCEDIEMEVFGQQLAGLTLLDNKDILLKNDYAEGFVYINSSQGVWINASDTDKTTYSSASLLVRGPETQWVHNEKINLHINGATIEEVKDNSGTTIGLNFIAAMS